MISSAIFWLILNILTILILAFYSMLEMACVSFNKVRLQYYVFKGNKQAEWLNWLLNNPTRLFGTTLLGVNIATVCGSEFAREFYSAIGLDPDLSPLTQVLLVVIFGELAPMFAARRYAEHVVMLGIPIIYASAKVLSPIIWAISTISKLFNKIIGGIEAHGNIFITQEELLKILEEQDEEKIGVEGEDFNAVTTNIFSLRQKNVKQVMEPLDKVSRISSNATVAQIANVLQNQTSESDYVIIYHREPTNIVGVVSARDLIRAPENKRVRDFAQPPWFVTQNTSLLKILNLFRGNNEVVAIILNEQGKAEGVLHINDIIEEIFGIKNVSEETNSMLFLERTFPGSMKIGDFNAQFDVILDKRENMTLSELIFEALGHHPKGGESIFIDPFELNVEETSLLEIKTVKITTKLK
jgi:putative hemolysin